MKIEEFKMKVTPEQSRVVQETLFKNGYYWRGGDGRVIHTDFQYLIFDNWLTCLLSDTVSFNAKSLPELTFQQFKQKYIDEEFVLPEKWCVRDCSEVSEYAHSKWGCGNFTYSTNLYYEGDEFSLGYAFSDKVLPGYTQITFEQFKKHVLKQDDMKEDNNIIGYKLKESCEKYNEAVLKMTGITKNKSIHTINDSEYDFSVGSFVFNEMVRAGVLDLWFDPVYEEKKKLPVIDGYYEGSIIPNGNIKYGCKILKPGRIIQLYRAIAGLGLDIDKMTLDSGETITVEQLRQIVEYIQSRD